MKKFCLILFLTFLASAYADQLVVTVTNEGVSVPTTFESGYTEFVLDNQASNVYAHEIVKLKDGADPELFKQGIIAFSLARQTKQRLAISCRRWMSLWAVRLAHCQATRAALV